MKRSEIINILSEQFIKREMANESGSKLAAHEILDIIETKGMLPPKIYKDVNDFALNYSDNPGELIELWAKNEWEKE
jgi:hypothetical protein